MFKLIFLIFFLSLYIDSVFADSNRIQYCKHTLLKNDTVSKAHGYFDFTEPFQANTNSASLDLNSHIKDFNKIKPGESVYIPIRKNSSIVNNNPETSCLELNNRTASYTQKRFNFYKSKIHQEQIKANMYRTLLKEASRQPSSKLQNIDQLQSKESSATSQWSLGLSSVFESIHSKEGLTSTVLVSEAQPRLFLEFKRHFSQQWKAFIRTDYVQQKYSGTENSSIMIKAKTMNTSKVNFGWQYSWEKSSFAELSLGFGDFVYYKALSTTQYDLISNKVTHIAFLLSQRLFSIDSLDLSALLHLGYTGSSDKDNTEFRGGFDHGMGLNFTLPINPNNALSLQFLYQQGQYKSSVAGFEKRWLYSNLFYRTRF